ncbi:MAG: HEAT repeat domain-containing protein [Candidatus Hydrogenedentes bacterium]|nr:HEAT repeat domain-containing protein [Candidatus Hydrogenedentota bacterium]
MTGLPVAAFVVCSAFAQAQGSHFVDSGGEQTVTRVKEIIQTVREFPFNPIEDGRSQEPALDDDGVADLGDGAWRVRLLAIRDLARLGRAAVPQLANELDDENSHVRHVAAFVLGLNPVDTSEEALIIALRQDKDPIVRSG